MVSVGDKSEGSSEMQQDRIGVSAGDGRFKTDQKIIRLEWQTNRDAEDGNVRLQNDCGGR